MKVASLPLAEVLLRARNGVLKEWLAQTLRTYPEQTARFLLQNKDPFRNPVGHTLQQGFSILLDELLGACDPARIRSALDGIVKVRAVQDFTAAQAVAFIFSLKRIVRSELNSLLPPEQATQALVTLEDRIDQMALLAFDLFMQCRERIYEIKASEAKRRVYLLERLHQSAPSSSGGGVEHGDGP